MSFENNFRNYLVALDGTPKEFSNVSHLFDQLYHPEFTLKEKGSNVNREQMKQIQAKAFALGSKATLLHYSNASRSTVEFKFRLVNDKWDIVIHNIVTVKDGKMFQAQPVVNTKPLLLVNFEAYVAALDGSPKDFSSVSPLFEEIYHNDFVYESDGKPINKEQMKQYHSNMFALGSKANLLLMKEVGPDSVEFKFSMANDKIDVVVHNIARVKDNKFISAAPVDQESMRSVSKVCEACDSCEKEEIFATKNKLSVEDRNANNTFTVPQ